MSVTLPSDEVAEDYKNALDDLVTSDKYQIANLTMIAKENVEHAEAIARVLTNHIKRAPPSRKQPALYVLDSLVKNIGSPYTVYFGRNLHETFMLAYSQVDANIRRKLEEMLKTWREPVPGSLSNIPVFPLPSTQTIVDSLHRFRASSTPVPRMNQGLPLATRVAQSQVLYRETPTPPQTTMHYPAATIPVVHPTPPPPPPTVSIYPQYQSQPVYQPFPGLNSGPSSFSTLSAPAQQPVRPPSRNSVDIARLHADIDSLTTDAKIECATYPMNAAAQRTLSTLQSLKEILDGGTASEQDLIDIRDSIAQQIAKKRQEQQTYTSAPPMPVIHQYPPAIPQQTSYQPSTQFMPQPSTPLPSLFNSANLADLLRATAAGNFNQQSTPVPAIQVTGTPPISHAAPVIQPENPLLAQLRASGLLSAASTPPHGTTPPNGLVPSSGDSSLVALTSSSIKIQRPQLVLNFLNSKPNQCATCGKRFTSDETGRSRKATHLDWHFKTKARLLEAEKRGQNRSWYVDEREWISNKEYEDDVDLTNDHSLQNGATALAVQKKTVDFVRAPTDAILRQMPCPIDQEPFKSEWSPELQDFIWKDAIRVGDRYFHASCYEELTGQRSKDAGRGTPLNSMHRRTATPDSVLGKRKADPDEPNSASKSRLKLES